jgi:hypothetical protein
MFVHAQHSTTSRTSNVTAAATLNQSLELNLCLRVHVYAVYALCRTRVQCVRGVMVGE